MSTYFTISFDYPSLANLLRFSLLGIDILSFGVYNQENYRGIVLCVLGLVFALETVPDSEEEDSNDDRAETP